MDQSIAIYKVWAPSENLWTAWAKPVLFANIDSFAGSTGTGAIEINEPKISLKEINDAAIIVDLPGTRSITDGLSYVKAGFRPIPLYNCVSGSGRVMVEVGDLTRGLKLGAQYITTHKDLLKDSSPPVFLLDSNRMSTRSKGSEYFDNRYSIFAQDMPSANYLKQNNINKIILISEHIMEDLSHILLRYQEAGIQILLADSSGELKDTKITKPGMFKSLYYRFQIIFGLSRNPIGGFGHLIKVDTASRSYRLG